MLSNTSTNVSHAIFGKFDSDPGISFSKRDYKKIVRQWNSPSDAILWIESVGLDASVLHSSQRLCSSRLPPNHARVPNETLRKLYRAITSDPRFEGKFRTFRMWLGALTDYNTIVASWLSPDDALRWAATKGISPSQLVSQTWLVETSTKAPSNGGIGECLNTLYKAIRHDPRFKGSFTNFRAWVSNINSPQESFDYSALLASWETPDSVLLWANTNNIAPTQIASSTWLKNNTEKYILSDGTSISTVSLYKAILKDERFKEGFLCFRQWIGKDKISFSKLVQSWISPEDATAWANTQDIPLDRLTSSKWLQRQASLSPSTGGIGRSLCGLYNSIVADTRFAGSFHKFRLWIGSARIDYRPIVASWTSPEQAIKWATENGITAEQLGTRKFIILFAQRTPEQGGIGRGLGGLFTAINEDPRFGSSFHSFRRWLGLAVQDRTDYKTLLSGWRDPDDARLWAEQNDLEFTNLGNAGYLKRNGLQGIYRAVREDLRFVNGFDSFRAWLGIAAKINFREIVTNWTTYGDARSWVTSHNIRLDDLASSSWLRKSSIKIGNQEEKLKNLQYAISKDPRFPTWTTFRAFLGIGTPELAETLKTIFATPEAAALEALAQALGPHASAEFLAVKYQDKFHSYGSELVENLRSYLGDIETPFVPSVTSLPPELFTLTELEHLRRSLFNSYRDAYQPLFSVSLDAVTKELRKLIKDPITQEHLRFIDSLIEYFAQVEELAHPSRLKTSLMGKGCFPAKHQKIAIYETMRERTILLGDEMGGGKTGSAIATFEFLRDQGKAKRALVIVPAKVIQVWKDALSTGNAGYFRSSSSPTLATLEGSEKNWKLASQSDYVLISLESLRGKTGGRSNVELCKELNADFLISDESHNAKSIKKRRNHLNDTERLFEVSKAPSIQEGYLMLLSGTPIPNTLRDLASQLRLLYQGREQASSSNLDFTDIRELARVLLNSPPLLVRNLLVRKMIRRKTEDCLPVGCTLNREVVELDMNLLDRSRYDLVLSNPLYSATEKIRALRKTLLLSESKFQGIKSHLYAALNNSKYQRAGAYPKVVIAESCYARGFSRNAVDARPHEPEGTESYLAARLQTEFRNKARIFILDGMVSDRKEEILRAFSDHQGPAILLTLVIVSGEGLNLTCAADGILISPSYTVSAEEQFIRRMYRYGQKLPVNFKILSFKDTIEDGILAYAHRKHRIVQGLISGRPLSKREEAILNSDFSAVKKGGIIAYETMTPRQQALWILSKIKGRGRDAVKDFLRADNGRYAKDFARGYPADEATSYSGNTARLVTSVVRDLSDQRNISLVDIACGCRTLERIFEGDRFISVHSLDINEAALNTGASLLKSPRMTNPSEIGSMDALTLPNNSQDIAVLSLALDMTQHTTRRVGGSERVAAIRELNRVLKISGHAVLTLQRGVFPSKTDFLSFVAGIEKFSGFTRVTEKTGLATAYNEESRTKYEVWLITLEKIRDVSEPLAVSGDVIKALSFPRIIRKTTRDTIPKRVIAEAREKSGAYQDTFIVEGGSELKYQPTTIHQTELEASRRRDLEGDKLINSRLQELKGKFGSINHIPDELLLSISPLQISQASQLERDEYFRDLIKRYGTIDRIPVEKITQESDIILIRHKNKKRGVFLCLAKISERGAKNRGFGARYFE